MGIFDSLRGHPDADAPRQAPAVPGGSGPGPADAGDGRASLERRRDELLAQVAELHWDLGGLAYEMAIRDHFRLDVLVRRAAELQERDAELGELEARAQPPRARRDRHLPRLWLGARPRRALLLAVRQGTDGARPERRDQWHLVERAGRRRNGGRDGCAGRRRGTG